MLFLKRFLSLLLVFLLSFSVGVNAKTVSSECDISDINQPFEMTSAKAEIGTKLDIKAKSAILLEAHTCKILYEQNADEKLAAVIGIFSTLTVDLLPNLYIGVNNIDENAFLVVENVHEVCGKRYKK